jgi:hypothetical protein
MLASMLGAITAKRIVQRMTNSVFDVQRRRGHRSW